MSSTPNITTKTVNIPANGSVDIAATGGQLKCLTNSGAAGSVRIRFGNGGTARFNVLDKYILPADERFTQFSLENQTGVAITMEIYIGDGDIQTGGDVTISGTVATKEAASDGIGSIADVTLTNGVATQILPADATRLSAVVVSDPANANNIRMADQANVGAARGALVQPGQPYTHIGTAALYGFVVAAGQKVSGTTYTRT